MSEQAAHALHNELDDGVVEALEAQQVKCRHCGETIEFLGRFWTHTYSGDYNLYRCQKNVAYGHNAAHPDIPCEPGGPNPCLCTYASAS